ncbi:MAG: magnesium/cobalt transporter CorA [Synechococcus sp.]|nr:magnesium/cobalt transporter CorA [Synechococcus sp.]
MNSRRRSEASEAGATNATAGSAAGGLRPAGRVSELDFQIPGTPVFVGERRREYACVDLFLYGSDAVREIHDATRADWQPLRMLPGVLWINVSAVHDIPLLESLGHDFGLHALTVEDIANTAHRPKWEEFPAYGFLTLKMVITNRRSQDIRIEHISLILGDGFVLSFLEDAGDVFESVRQRIRRGAGRVRGMGADYLAFCLVDAVIDHCFLAVESIGDRVEHFEEQLLANALQAEVSELYRFKRYLMHLRRAVWPLREVLSAMIRSEMTLLEQQNMVFWRDLYDQTVQVIDRVEAARESLAAMHDTYLSSLSNHMNEVMKVLAIISTIFIPLTFIAGVYGMNFKNMPELEWKAGYFLILGLMATIATGLVLCFRRQRWL